MSECQLCPVPKPILLSSDSIETQYPPETKITPKPLSNSSGTITATYTTIKRTLHLIIDMSRTVREEAYGLFGETKAPFMGFVLENHPKLKHYSKSNTTVWNILRENLPGYPGKSITGHITEAMKEVDWSPGEYEEILGLVPKVLDVLYANLHTWRQKMTAFRQMTRSALGDEIAGPILRGVLCLPCETHKLLEERDTKQRTDSNHHNIVLTINQVGNLIGEIRGGVEGMKDWALMAIYVGICTGSRAVEIMKLSDFTPDETNEHCVLVTGIAKRGERGINRSMTRPILDEKATGKSIRVIVTKLRQLKNCANMTNLEVGKACHRALGRKLRALCKELPSLNRVGWKPDRTLTFKDLRAIYANAMFAKVGAQTTKSQTAYLSSILGHESMSTALSYQVIKLVGDKESGVPPVIKNEKHEAKLKRRKEIVADIGDRDISYREIRRKYHIGAAEVRLIIQKHRRVRERCRGNPTADVPN